MAKLYKVRTAPGFNAAGRRRAGLSFSKGQTQILELSKEQLAELESDVWLTVQEADKDAVPTAAGESAPDTTQTDGDDETETDPYEGKKLPELKAMAAEAGLDAEKLRSKQEVIDLIEASKTDESDDEDEEVELSEDMTLEELKTIATDQGVDAAIVEAAGEDDKADLIKAIEEASENNTEE